MECFLCRAPYNESENCPRLLINCGHSLCQRCLSENFRQGIIICPECRTLNKSQSLSDFPKNLALLHLKPTPLVERQVNRALPTPVESEPLKDLSALCQKHKKKIEAFCENDRQLLCITCILEEGYKNQDICSIQDAAHKERNLIQKAFELSQIIEGKLKDIQKEITQSYAGLTEAAEKSRVEITQFFNEIRKVIAERETTLKQKLSEHLRKQEHLLKKKDESISKHLKNISGFYEEYQRSLAEKEIPLLNASPKRIEIIKKATMDIEKLSTIAPFTELNKENELNLLWKMIQPAKASYKEVPLAPNHLQGVKNPKTANVQANPVKVKANKEPTKNTGAAIVRNSMNLKKEAVTAAGPGQGQSGHPFVFSIVDKNGNKIPAQEKNMKQKEDLGVENKRANEKRQASPVRATSAKNKYPQSYYALRNSQKDREALQEKVAIGDQVGLSDSHERQAENKSSKSNLALTPKREIRNNEEYSGSESGGSNTPTQKNEQIAFEPSAVIAQSRSTGLGSLQYNHQWAEPMNMNRVGQEDRDLGLKQMRNETNKGLMHHHDNFGFDAEGRAQLGKLYDMNNSSIDHQSVGGSIIEMSIQRDFKMLASEIGTSTLDMMDLANHKLDFSLLCQHATSFIYVMGGFVENSQYFIEKFDLQKGKWEIAGTFINNRTKFSSLPLVDRGTILILGGKQDGARTAACEEYSLTDQVIQHSDMTLTSPKSGFGAILIRDDIYICGGNDGHSILKTFESYNVKTRKWIALPPMELRRDELALTIGPDQKIYAIGGFGGPNNTCLNEVERYDFHKGRWESIAPLNTARRALAAVTLPDGIYAIGGFDGENYLSTVEKYEEATNEWVLVASMNYPRCTLSAVASSDFRNIYVLGGFDNGPLKTVERYSVIDDTWEIMPPMYFKRFMHSAVMISK